MSFDAAHQAKKSRKAYRDALWKARASAMELAAKMLAAAAEGDGVVSPEVVKTMAEVLRDAREVLDGDQGKAPRKNRPGSPVDADALIKGLEG